MMKRILSTAVMFAILATTAVASAKVRKGDRAKELKGVVTATGSAFSLKSLRGKVVVLSFGASWCTPCKKELPALEKLAKKSSRDVVYLAVNIDSSIATGKKFVTKLGLKAVKVVFDPKNRSVGTYDPPTMPTTFVIDKKGIVRWMHTGYRSGDEKKIAKQAAKLL